MFLVAQQGVSIITLVVFYRANFSPLLFVHLYLAVSLFFT